MVTSKLLYGDKVEQVCAYTVGQAWQRHTPQALRDADRELQGIYRFLLWTGTGTADADICLKIQNTQRQCLIMAEALESA